MNRTPAISSEVPIGKRIKGAEMLSFMPGAHLPKFVLQRHDHVHELRQAMGTSKSNILKGPAYSHNAGNQGRRARTAASSTLPEGETRDRLSAGSIPIPPPLANPNPGAVIRPSSKAGSQLPKRWPGVARPAWAGLDSE